MHFDDCLHTIFSLILRCSSLDRSCVSMYRLKKRLGVIISLIVAEHGGHGRVSKLYIDPLTVL